MICDAKTYLYPPGSQESLDAIALSTAFDERERSVPAEIRDAVESTEKGSKDVKAFNDVKESKEQYLKNEGKH